jgi:hypothetical protein
MDKKEFVWVVTELPLPSLPRVDKFTFFKATDASVIVIKYNGKKKIARSPDTSFFMSEEKAEEFVRKLLNKRMDKLIELMKKVEERLKEKMVVYDNPDSVERHENLKYE